VLLCFYEETPTERVIFSSSVSVVLLRRSHGRLFLLCVGHSEFCVEYLELCDKSLGHSVFLAGHLRNMAPVLI
jgi:hypothetical protein